MASEKPTGRIVSSRYHRCIDLYIYFDIISNISLNCFFNKFYELLAGFLGETGRKTATDRSSEYLLGVWSLFF